MRNSTISSAKRIALAQEFWGWEPHPTQREWLLDEHPVKVAACGRRWGKTESAAVDIATYALTHLGSVQMIVAPTYDQSKLISGTVERLMLQNPKIGRQVQTTKTPYPDIRFLGSRIMARTADDDGRNLRGHSADRVIVDEAAFVRDVVIEEVIGPMLADRDGQLVMISTPFGKNHFYRAFTQGMVDGSGLMVNEDPSPESVEANHEPSTISRMGDSRVRSFRFPSWANPHISMEYIEHQRAVISDRQFKVEYEAEFVDDTNSVFPWADIQAAVYGQNVQHLHASGGTPSVGGATPNVQLPTEGQDDRASRIEYPGSSVRVAGIDWARYSDYTAVVILEVSPTQAAGQVPYRVTALDRFNRMDWHSQVDRVCDLLAEHGVIAVTTDQTSIGDPVLEILRTALWTDRRMDISVEGVVFTNQVKREMVDNLAIRLAHGTLGIPRDEQLIRELQYYEYELTESGNVRTGARRGHHDDCVMALSLALQLAPRYAFTGGFASSGRKIAWAKAW